MRTKLSPEVLHALPPEVREKLGGSGEVEFIEQDDGWLLRPVRDEVNPFLAWIGIAPLPDGMTAVEWVRSIRDPDE